MPISERDIPWLGFRYADRCFCHVALPFGLAVAPREWQRLMYPIICRLGSMWCLCWVYLDDFLILGQTAAEVLYFTDILVQMLDNLGLEKKYSEVCFRTGQNWLNPPEDPLGPPLERPLTQGPPGGTPQTPGTPP